MKQCRERRWQVLTVVSVAVFMASLDLFIVNVASPDLAADFARTSVAGLSWVLNAYAIVFAALLVAPGRLADRLGRRRAFLAGVVVFLVGSALCGAAPSVEALVAARVLQAVGAAVLMPTSLALLLPEFAPRERPAAIGVWAAVGGVAAAAGPPLGGLLVETSWRLVFLVNLPVGIAAVVVGARLLAETRDETDRAWPDWLGTALLASAIGLLALGVVQAPTWGWGGARTLATLGAAALGLAAFARRSGRHPSPVVDPAMLRVRSFAMANAAALLFSAAFAAMLLQGVLFMTGVWGDSVLVAGVSLAPGPLTAAVFAVRAGRLANDVGQRALVAAGCTTFAVGCAWWLVRLGPEHAYLTGMLPGLLVTGVGVGLTLPSVASAITSSLPPHRFATGSAVLTMSRQLGSVFGVAILVAILAGGDTDGGWAFMVVAALLGAVAGLAIGPVTQPAAAPAPAAATASAA